MLDGGKCAIKDCFNEATKLVLSRTAMVMIEICQRCHDELLPGRVIVKGDNVYIEPWDYLKKVDKRRDDIFRKMCG